MSPNKSIFAAVGSSSLLSFDWHHWLTSNV
jgi:hypothetical protein